MKQVPSMYVILVNSPSVLPASNRVSLLAKLQEKLGAPEIDPDFSMMLSAQACLLSSCYFLV